MTQMRRTKATMKREKSIASTSGAISRASTGQTVDVTQHCEYCGRNFDLAASESIWETTINIIAACVLLAILIPVGYQANKWVTYFCLKSMHHLLWHEPLDDSSI